LNLKEKRRKSRKSAEARRGGLDQKTSKYQGKQTRVGTWKNRFNKEKKKGCTFFTSKVTKKQEKKKLVNQPRG